MRNLTGTAFVGVCVVTVLFACGSNSDSTTSSSTSSSGGSSSGGSSGTSSSGGSSGSSGSDSGAEAGVEAGADADAGPKCGAEGAACAGGSCTRDVCRPDVTISGNVNLSADAVTQGRTCAEAISFSVTALGATTATLASAPDAGCFAADDEVLLINLQGTASATANVGVFENLRVASVSGGAITFTAAKTRFFGDAAGGDANIGTGADKQKVMLMRVPNFGKLTIAAAHTVTAAAWDGLKGGVVALRTNALTLDGMIDARRIGYRGGRWSADDDTCDDSVQTEAGESIGGPGAATLDANGGGAGGIGAADSIVYNQSEPLNASAGHASPGQAGGGFAGRAAGAPGGTYGLGDGTRLTMGSGGGGNLLCQIDFGPALVDFRIGVGGGIVAVFGGNITVSATGTVDSAPAVPLRSVPSAGYVLLRGDVIDFSAGKVQAKAVPGSDGFGTFTNMGSEGRIAILYKTSTTGAAEPAAFTQQIAEP